MFFFMICVWLLLLFWHQNKRMSLSACDQKLCSAWLLSDNVLVDHESLEKQKSDLWWFCFHENCVSSCLWEWSVSDYSAFHVLANLLSSCVFCWLDCLFSFCDENWDCLLKHVHLINSESFKDDELKSCCSCDYNFLMMRSRCL